MNTKRRSDLFFLFSFSYTKRIHFSQHFTFWGDFSGSLFLQVQKKSEQIISVMSGSSTCSSSVRPAPTATSSSTSLNASIPAASHHLPPPLNGYTFVKHVRSALSHDTFLGQVVDTQREKTQKKQTKKVIRVYALDYLRRDEECRFTLERECMAARIIDRQSPHTVTVDRVFASKTDLFLVEDYCSGGDLYEYMVGVAKAAATVAATTHNADSQTDEESTSGNGLAVELVRRLARDLLTGVYYLHTTCRLVHRNIKLETLFLDAAMRLRIGGFGLSAVLPPQASSSNDKTKNSSNGREAGSADPAAVVTADKGSFSLSADVAAAAAAGSGVESTALMRLCCGSKHYAAPELIQGQPYQGEAVDAWACGVVLFALLTGCFPFDSVDGDDETLFTLVCHHAEAHLAQHPALASIGDPQAIDLIRNILRVNPKTRYTVSEALDHPFLA